MNGSRSTASAIAATASPTAPAARSTSPVRCRARPSRSIQSPAIPTAAISLHVDAASTERIAPICPHFGVCGGCAVQHWDTARYRAWKRDLVVEALRAGRPRRAGRRPHRRAWRGPPPRRLPCPARRARRARSRLLAARAAIASSPIDRCPILARSLDGAIDAAWAIAEALDATRKAARHPDHRDRRRARRRRARLRPADGAADGGARARCAGAQSRPPHPPRRIDRAAASADRAHRQRDRGAAAGGVPAGDRGRRGDARAARARRLRGRRDHRRPVCRRRPVRAPARRARPRRRRRRRRSRARRAQARVRRPPPASSRSTVERRDLFRRPLAAAELKRFDAVVFDPPRQGAQAQARELAASSVARHRRGVVQSRPRSRATPANSSAAAIASARSRRSTSSATPRMSRSSRDWKNSRSSGKDIDRRERWTCAPVPGTLLCRSSDQ